MATWMMNGLVSWLITQLIGLLTDLAELFTVTVFTSPDVTVLPQVKGMAAKCSLVVTGSYVLVILAAWLMVMTGGTESRYQAKDLIQRLLVGFGLSAFALPICSVVIEVANGLVGSIVGTGRAPVQDVIAMTSTHLQAAAKDPASALVVLVLGLIIAFLLGCFLFSFLGRIGLLVVLAGISPVALACYGSPYTQPAADLWWRSLLGATGTAVLQGITFSLGMDLLVNPESSLPVVIGMPGSGLVNLLLAMAVLWTTVRIPGLMRRYVTQRGGVNMAAVILRSVAVQTVARRLPFVR